jgi:hypothetical protein
VRPCALTPFRTSEMLAFPPVFSCNCSCPHLPQLSEPQLFLILGSSYRMMGDNNACEVMSCEWQWVGERRRCVLDGLKPPSYAIWVALETACPSLAFDGSIRRLTRARLLAVDLMTRKNSRPMDCIIESS